MYGWWLPGFNGRIFAFSLIEVGWRGLNLDFDGLSQDFQRLLFVGILAWFVAKECGEALELFIKEIQSIIKDENDGAKVIIYVNGFHIKVFIIKK